MERLSKKALTKVTIGLIIKTIKEKKEVIKMTYVGGTQQGLDLAYKLVQLGGTLKVTKIEEGPWNDLEGQNYTVRIKATAPKGKLWSSNKRKSMLFEFETNSTWLDNEEWGDMGEEESIKEMIYNVVA